MFREKSFFLVVGALCREIRWGVSEANGSEMKTTKASV